MRKLITISFMAASLLTGGNVQAGTDSWRPIYSFLVKEDSQNQDYLAAEKFCDGRKVLSFTVSTQSPSKGGPPESIIYVLRSKGVGEQMVSVAAHNDEKAVDPVHMGGLATLLGVVLLAGAFVAPPVYAGVFVMPVAALAIAGTSSFAASHHPVHIIQRIAQNENHEIRRIQTLSCAGDSEQQNSTPASSTHESKIF